jgi:hypothetical protein
MRLLRQPTKQEADEKALADPPASWEALHREMWVLLVEVTNLNDTPPIRGERRALVQELERMLGEFGPPAEVPEARAKAFRARLKRFRDERAADHKLAHEAWAVLTDEYLEEMARLQASAEPSDRRAADILAERYSHCQERLRVGGAYAIPEDAGPLAQMLAGESHITTAWEQEVIEYTKPKRVPSRPGRKQAPGGGSSWPWTPFKVASKLVHGAAIGLHAESHARAHEITQALDSALRNQIRTAARTALELGDDPADVARWSKNMREAALRNAVELGKHASKYERWAGKLHTAGKLMIYIDIGASFIDVVTSPPKERPKKIIVQASRIAAGLAGASLGARAGASAGGVFGAPGRVVGGIFGGLGGGLAGAFFAKKIATFVTDLIWPPDDTYWEETRAGP